MKDLEGKVALITGASRGIGKACAISLAKAGATVIINYRSNAEAAEQAKSEVEAAGGTAVLCQFDVADSAAVKEAVSSVVKDLGKLDILVNNAGIARNGLAMRFKDADWAATMDTNLAGAFYVTRAAASWLLKAKEDGRIVFLTSVVGEMGNAGQAGYAASKAGLIGLTKSLAKEFSSRGVCVNAVAPGFIATDMTDDHMSDEQRNSVLSAIPLGRIGDPSDVAEAVTFLCTPRAKYITGQVLRVNGGLLM